MTGLIQEGIKERLANEVDDPVYTEVTSHAVFCKTKCQKFHGRTDLMDVSALYSSHKACSK